MRIILLFYNTYMALAFESVSNFTCNERYTGLVWCQSKMTCSNLPRPPNLIHSAFPGDEGGCQYPRHVYYSRGIFHVECKQLFQLNSFSCVESV